MCIERLYNKEEKRMRCFDVSVFFFASCSRAYTYIIGRKPIDLLKFDTSRHRVALFYKKVVLFVVYIWGRTPKMYKKGKNVKNVLDKHKNTCYNIASRLERWIFITVPKKISKKVKKLLQKVLTSGFGCDIISKSLRKLRHRSLKIEQQERSTKL